MEFIKKEDHQSEELTGGREGKIRKDNDKVIRPSNPWTPHVHAFLRYLKGQGMENIPTPYGLTESGEEIVSFVEGIVYNEELPASILTDEILVEVAQLLRRYHDLGAAYMAKLSGDEVWMLPARTPAEVMCHGDFAPYNITFTDGHVHGIIDFDTLHPGSRL